MANEYTYANVLARYNRGAPGLSAASFMEPAARFGLSEEEVARGMDAGGQWHTNRFGSGWTSLSSTPAIVNGSIQNALNARANPNYYSGTWRDWEGGGAINGALSYADTPERIAAHRQGDLAALTGSGWTANLLNTLNTDALYGSWSNARWDEDAGNRITSLAIDAGIPRFNERLGHYLNTMSDAGAAQQWWGPEEFISHLASDFGFDPNKYVNEQRRLTQQDSIGKNWQEQEIRAGQQESENLGTLLGVTGAFIGGLGALGAFSGLGAAGSGAAADIIGSDFAAGVGGSLGGVAGDVAAAANTLGGTIAPGWTSAEGGAGYLGGAASDAGALAGAGSAPGWTSGQDLLGGADLNFQNMSAPATGGTSGGNAMDWTDFLPSGTDSGGSFLDYIPQDAGPLTDVGSNLNAGDLLQQFSDVAGQAGSAGSNLLNQIRNLPSSAVQSLTQGGQNSALGRILGGNASTSDWASLLGMLGTGALSAYSANQNANAMKEIADRSWNAGAPYRDKLSATYSNPGAYLDSPEVQAILNRSQNALARSLSARDGNPIGSGRALNEMNDYAAQTMLGQLGNYRQQLANFGGQSALSGTYPQLGSQAADASSNIYNSLANTVSRVTQPQTDWQNILRMYGGGNGLA